MADGRVLPYSIIIPLERLTVTRFSRRDLETFAKVQFACKLPEGMFLPAKPEFTISLAENRNPGSRFTHVMRVQAEVLA